jgi:hypothetical protein
MKSEPLLMRLTSDGLGMMDFGQRINHAFSEVRFVYFIPLRQNANEALYSLVEESSNRGLFLKAQMPVSIVNVTQGRNLHRFAMIRVKHP